MQGTEGSHSMKCTWTSVSVIQPNVSTSVKLGSISSMHMARSDPVCMTVIEKAVRVGIYTKWWTHTYSTIIVYIQQTYNAWGSDNTGYRVRRGGRLIK